MTTTKMKMKKDIDDTMGITFLFCLFVCLVPSIPSISSCVIHLAIQPMPCQPNMETSSDI